MRDMSISLHEARIEAMNSFLRKVYHWMAVGLILTAVVAHWVASNPSVFQAVAGFMIVLLIAELALVIGLSWGINRISATTAMVVFMVYSLLNGVTLSVVLLVYTREAVASAFFTAAGMFGGMSLYGLYTKRDLSELHSFLMMGLIGLVFAGIVNIFVGNGVADIVISAIGILVFMGLTAYDTQYLRNLGAQVNIDSGDENAQKLAVIGALKLYLDFVNLFLYLLRFFGKRRN